MERWLVFLRVDMSMFLFFFEAVRGRVSQDKRFMVVWLFEEGDKVFLIDGG